MSKPNRVLFYARRKMEVIAEQRFCGVGAWNEANVYFQAQQAEAATIPGRQVRMRRYRFGYSVFTYQRHVES